MRTRILAGAGALAVLHFLFRVGLGWGGAAPDLLTLAVLLAVREMGMGWGAFTGLCCGIVEDALSVLAFGASAVALAVVGAIGSRTRDLFVGDSRVFALTYLFVGKWVRDLIGWLLSPDGVREPFVRAVLLDGLAASLYMAGVGLVVITVLGVPWGSGRETLR